jgi:16S rRNA (guanine527-N7)-methyltransferase
LVSKIMDKSLLRQNAQKLGVDIQDVQLEEFATYQKELLHWNARINLVSEKSSQQIVNRHFLDSLTALQFIELDDFRILDIGTGAGFPGLPLKIVRPSLKLYLLESNRKKVSFLKHVIRKLHLEDAYVVHDRVENILQKDIWKEFFDIVISRAAFNLPELLSFGAFFLAPQGKLVALKGSDVETEFINCVKNATAYNFGELFQCDVDHNLLGLSRKIIVGKKVKKDKKTF